MNPDPPSLPKYNQDKPAMLSPTQAKPLMKAIAAHFKPRLPHSIAASQAVKLKHRKNVKYW